MPKEDKAKEQKELQKKYLQLQLLRQYANAMLEEKNALDTKIAELAVTAYAIENLEKAEKGQQMWSSLGSDVYMRSDIIDAGNVIVGLGASVYAVKNAEGALATLNSRREEYEKVSAQMTAEIMVLAEQLQQLEAQVQELAQKTG